MCVASAAHFFILGEIFMKKALKIVIQIAVIVLIIGGVFGYITYHDNAIYKAMQEQITVSNKTVELQKGEVEISVNDMINLNDLNCTALFENESDRLNINAKTVGEQTVKIIVTANNTLFFDKAIELNAKIIIVDTVPPEFTESVDEIKITEGDELDILSKFKAQDLSGEVEITLDGEFDNNKVGEQVLKVIAKDINSNMAEKEVKIIVNEKVVVTAKPTASSNNNNKPSNSNSSRPASNSGNSSSSSNGGSSSSSSSVPSTSGCASGNHSIGVGNIGRWFNSRSEVDAYFSSTCTQMWNKYQSGAITRDEYIKNCPQGYKAWSCSNCGKWTGSFTY